MASPILVTGAAGRVGAVGRTVTELLLQLVGEQGKSRTQDRAEPAASREDSDDARPVYAGRRR